MATIPGTESVRFRRPTNKNDPKPEPKLDQFGSQAPQGWKRRHQGLLQDLLRRQAQGPLVPSLSVAFRMLLLIRSVGALYATIADCDEVFNFYEPLHFLQHGGGFQTWELSPEFGIRSWAYILLHWPFAHLVPSLLRLTKRGEFFALRLSFAALSSFCEAKFYRAITESLNERVGRYTLFMLFLSAGMYNASISFLPSTFTMYTTMLAFSYSLHPATTTPTGTARATKATVFFALGAIVGWPFSALLAVPFVFEQLFMNGDEIAEGQARSGLLAKRWSTLTRAVAMGASIAIPVYLIDSWAYGRWTFPTWNIIYYNIISPLGGPELYGSEPATFYLANLFVNFNFLLPFALISLPALAVTYRVDNRRVGRHQRSPLPSESSPYTLLALRLAPFYIWLVIFTLQPHKEERFLVPAYPLFCVNAAVGLYLVKGWMERVYIKITASPYNASQSQIFSNFTLSVVLFTSIFSLARIYALFRFYHAPIEVAYHFQSRTIPAILGAQGYTPAASDKLAAPGEVIQPVWDYTALYDLEPRVNLCYGAEWYRFPSSYLVPEGIEVNWVRGEFGGMMPRRWDEDAGGEIDVEGKPEAEEVEEEQGWWPKETSMVRAGRFNGENKPSAEPGTFVSSDTCDYIVALSLPSRKPTALEPDWTQHPEWEVEHCVPFLDAAATPFWARLVDLPRGAGGFEGARTWGRYCLVRRKGTAYGTA